MRNTHLYRVRVAGVVYALFFSTTILASEHSTGLEEIEVLAHFAALVSAAKLALAAAQPNVDAPDETIDGFPEFAFTADTIKDPAAMQKLRALAKRIVLSHQGSKRIIGFEVHGHADVTLRIPPGSERDRTEFEVSRDRAENAKALLLKLIEEEGGRPIIEGIRANATSNAFGSRFTKFKPARNEAEMRKNRRVEIFLKTFDPPPPKPTPPEPPKPPKAPETGSNWRIRIKSGRVVQLPIPNFDLVPVRINLTVEITDIDRNQTATFEATSTGQALPGGAVGPPQFFTPIPPGDPTEFTTISGTTLNRFEGAVLIAQNPAIGVLVTKGGEFVFDFEALGPVLTRPRQVEVSPGFSLALPTLGGGIAPAFPGSMTMQGGPR